MSQGKALEEHAKAKEAWEANASFWDEIMQDEGNAFTLSLVWPAFQRMIPDLEGKRVLEFGCGNGVISRKLAKAGAKVRATDFSEALISLAEERGGAGIEYSVLDATDLDALLAQGKNEYDIVLSSMALFDMSDIRPLAQALPDLLTDAGCFAFTIIHPCFNNPSTVHLSELEDRDGELITTNSIKLSRYKTSVTELGVCSRKAPQAHPYFHRSLSELLGTFFAVGLVVDALEEPCFEPHSELPRKIKLGWTEDFSEFPPALGVRMARK